jgi:hypothetical protein
MLVSEVPGILRVEWNSEGNTMVDTWTKYSITVEQFRQSVLIQGIAFAKAHGVKSWVMDASKATGAFSRDVQNLIEAENFPTFARAGIKYFLTIKSNSAITNMSIGGYASKLGPNGIQMVDVPDLKGAIAWLKAHP